MRLGRCRVDVGCDGIDPKMWTVRLGFFVLAVLLFAAGHWAGAGTAGEVHTVVRRVLSPVPQVEPAAAPLWGAASVTRLRDVALDYTVGSAMSPADASSTCAAIVLPFSITLSDACAMAVPLNMADRDPPVPPPVTS